MKPPPSCLPPAASPKWHSRRVWDWLGYLRVRSLANPEWRRDVPWLTRLLRRETPPVDHQLRPLYDAAVAAAVRYPRTRSGTIDADAAWDELLTAIDAVLVQRQQDHLDAARAAGVSGQNSPPPEDNVKAATGE